MSVAYEVHLSDVKTAAGRRTIDLDEGTVAVLEQWRASAPPSADGRRPADTDLVFTKADGNWVHPDIFSQTFDRKVAKLDVPSHLPARPPPHPRHDHATGHCCVRCIIRQGGVSRNGMGYGFGRCRVNGRPIT